jgi:orotidine-5'-phosphate decarboxylase
MSEADLVELGYSQSPGELVSSLATLAMNSGMDGVVCSAQEAPALRTAHPRDFCLVTPGIRLEGDDADDQRRVLTPAAAMAAGASYLVIGRSVTAASDPLQALSRVQAQLPTP